MAEDIRTGALLRGHARQQAVGKQFNILGKQGEEQLDEEMGDLFRFLAAPAQAVGQLRKVAGGLFGDLLRSLRGLESRGVVKQVAQRLQAFGGRQIIQSEGGNAFNRVGKVGVNLERIDIRDDQQGRVFEGFAVLEKLLVSLIQVGVFALVFPGKMPAVPHIGEAVAAGQLPRPGLEGEERALGVKVSRSGVVDESADVEKMLLIGGAFFEFCLPPFGDELMRGESGHDDFSVIVIIEIFPIRAKVRPPIIHGTQQVPI